MSQQLTTTASTNRHYPTGVFTRCSLELTLRLLNEHHPLLALELHRALRRHFAAVQTGNHPGDCLKAELLECLDPKAISGIIATLTRLIRQALADEPYQPDRATILHGLVRDWSELAEWLLLQSSSQRCTGIAE